MNEVAIQKVKLYLDEQLFEPEYSWPEEAFKERSYARWAAIEILHKLMDRPFDPPEDVVEEFMYKMESISITTKNAAKSRIFTIARDTAEEILQILEPSI